MKKYGSRLFCVILFLLCALMPLNSVSAAELSEESSSRSACAETAYIFAGEGVFSDFEKKLKIEDSLDYFFTEESMSLRDFENTVLPCILELLGSETDLSFHVIFSFGETDSENTFAYPMGVGAEIAALINELSALYPGAEFCFAALSPSGAADPDSVTDLNETVAEYSLSETVPMDEAVLAYASDVQALRSSPFLLLRLIESLKAAEGNGNSGLLYADGTGYLFDSGSFEFSFTGLRDLDGTVYYFENGVFRTDYEGTALLGSEEYQVKNGVIDFEKNGTFREGNAVCTYENGRLVSREETGKSYTAEELHAMKAVFLTFDDGPSEVTEQLLDILDQYGVRATFFVTRQTAFTDVMKDAASRGHAIGVHTSSHVYDTIYSSFEAWKADFDEIYAWVTENTGTAPTAYRFPGGSNTNRPAAEDKEKMKDYVHSLGMEYYDWNVVTGDGDWHVTAEEEFVNATSEIDYRTLPVILAHDAQNNKSTAEAMPEILAELTGRGYRFMTLGPGIPPVQQGELWDY